MHRKGHGETQQEDFPGERPLNTHPGRRLALGLLAPGMGERTLLLFEAPSAASVTAALAS